jgi:hypothetical protein
MKVFIRYIIFSFHFYEFCFLFRNLSNIAIVLFASCYRKVKIIYSSQLFYCNTFRFHENCFYFSIYSNQIKEKSMDFLNLTFDEMQCILSDDRLNVRREEITYEAIVKWVSNNIQRTENFNKLLRFVRFGNSQVK